MPIVHNVDVATHAQAEAIRAVLVPHVYSPVPWTRTIEFMRAQGIDTIVECGPGKILAGLVRRIDRSLAALPVFDQASLDKATALVHADA